MFLEQGVVLRQELFSLLNTLEIQGRLIEKRIMKRIFFASLALILFEGMFLVRATPAQAATKITPGTIISAELSKTVDVKKVKAGDKIEAKTAVDLLSDGYHPSRDSGNRTAGGERFKLFVDEWRPNREFGGFDAERRPTKLRQLGRFAKSEQPGSGWTERAIAE